MRSQILAEAFIWDTVCLISIKIEASWEHYLSVDHFDPLRLLNWPKSPHHLGLKKLFIVAGGDTHCRTTISTYHISKIKISLLLTLIFPSLLIFFFKTDIRGETRLFYERINIMLFFSFLVFWIMNYALYISVFFDIFL